MSDWVYVHSNWGNRGGCVRFTHSERCVFLRPLNLPIQQNSFYRGVPWNIISCSISISIVLFFFYKLALRLGNYTTANINSNFYVNKFEALFMLGGRARAHTRGVRLLLISMFAQAVQPRVHSCWISISFEDVLVISVRFASNSSYSLGHRFAEIDSIV